MKFPPSRFFASYGFWLCISLFLLPLMITNESIWLDEGDTAMYALQPNIHSWWEHLQHDNGADCQMPLSMFCSWLGGQICGVQEWQLRAINLLWGALALIAASIVGRRLKLPWLPMLLAIQPYFWFYMNEARPYALEIAGGACLLAALIEFYFARATGITWAWLMTVAIFLLCCATMLAPLPLAATLFAGSFIMWRQHWKPQQRAILILLGGLAACVPLGIYYFSTLLRGVKGAEIWHVDLKFFAYVIYELTGMGGIGLSAIEIRHIARSPHWLSLLFTHAAQLVLPILMFFLLIVILCVGLNRRPKDQFSNAILSGIFVVLGITTGVFILASLILQKAFWARHYAPIFPFYVALLGIAFAGMKRSSRSRLHFLPAILCLLLFWSALQFRFAPSLRKEDYRSAVASVRPFLLANETVWWDAGQYAAAYYGLPMAYPNPAPGKAFLPYRSDKDVRSLPPPSVIAMSKPDIHDPSGVIRQIIAKHHYEVAARYQSFVIWTNDISQSDAPTKKY